MYRKSVLFPLCFITAFTMSLPGYAAENAGQEVQAYREMLSDPFANPGLLWIDRGEVIYREKRGPKNASLERCNLGLGPGKLNGAFAQLPRYFKDTSRVEDLESRLLTCMVTLQGIDREEAIKSVFSTPDRPSDMEALAAFVASKSNGAKIKVRLKHPKEKEAHRIGEKLFWRRAGVMDFSCATCHTQDNQRIRLQPLMNTQRASDVQEVMAHWPTYRVSHGTVRTMQHRMWDCHWQMRLPDIDYASDATVALITFLTKRGEGAVVAIPGMRR